MTHLTRRLIFYALVLLFFVAGSGAILYAQGWRLDLSPLRAEKVGAIFVRSSPGDAEIFLNGAPIENQTDILSDGTFINNLFPNTYRLTLEETGYDDWNENAMVTPTLIAQFGDAVLVPSVASPAASGSVESFSIEGGEAITENTSGTVTWHGNAIGKGAIISASANLDDVIIKNPATGALALYNFTEGTSLNLGALFAGDGIVPKNIANIGIDPFDATRVIAGNTQKIGTVDLAKGAVTRIAAAAAGDTLGTSIAPSQSLLAWSVFKTASDTASIALYDKFADFTTTSSAAVAGENVSLQWITGTLLGVLQNDGALYLYDTNAQTFKKMADGVKSFSASSDGSMIAALETHSLEVFPLSGNSAYSRFNLPDTADATGVMWYKDDGHLFVKYPDRVAFLDLNDAALTNFTTVAAGTSPFYDAQANALYLIDQNSNLVQFDFP